MQNKGIVITEITEPQICNPPKRMLVWDFDVSKAVEKNVVAILPRKYECTVVVEETESCAEGFYRHCAEIPEAPSQSEGVQMSELKAYPAYNVYNRAHALDESLVYIKSEADKVIAEKDTKIIQLEALIENYNRISREIIDNANHQKYKRCLAMARWCASRFVVWTIDGNERKSNWYWKWKERWKNLAEKFKEEK